MSYLAPFTLAFGRGFNTPVPHLRLSVNLLEVARGEISLQHWYASGGSIRAVLLGNRTNVNGKADIAYRGRVNRMVS